MIAPEQTASDVARLRDDSECFTYPAAYASAEMTEGVLLEMGCRGGSYPVAQHAIRSMVAEHAVTVLGEDDNAWVEFVPFDVSVSPVATVMCRLGLRSAAPPRRSAGRQPRPLPDSQGFADD